MRSEETGLKGEGEMRSEEKWWGSEGFASNQTEFSEWGVKHGSHKKYKKLSDEKLKICAKRVGIGNSGILGDEWWVINDEWWVMKIEWGVMSDGKKKKKKKIQTALLLKTL